MSKITLKLDDFKALASDSRLDILKALDKRKMNLRELSSETKLHKMTLHEHLSKLVESGFVKRIERKGHKWVYYKLTWKGESLFHPDNTKVVVLFSSTMITLIAGIIGFITVIQNYINYESEGPIRNGPIPHGYPVFNQDPILIYLSIICFIIFVILLFFSIKLYKNNKEAEKIRQML